MDFFLDDDPLPTQQVVQQKVVDAFRNTINAAESLRNTNYNPNQHIPDFMAVNNTVNYGPSFNNGDTLARLAITPQVVQSNAPYFNPTLAYGAEPIPISREIIEHLTRILEYAGDPYQGEVPTLVWPKAGLQERPPVPVSDVSNLSLGAAFKQHCDSMEAPFTAPLRVLVDLTTFRHLGFVNAVALNTAREVVLYVPIPADTNETSAVQYLIHLEVILAAHQARIGDKSRRIKVATQINEAPYDLLMYSKNFHTHHNQGFTFSAFLNANPQATVIGTFINSSNAPAMIDKYSVLGVNASHLLKNGQALGRNITFEGEKPVTFFDPVMTVFDDIPDTHGYTMRSTWEMKHLGHINKDLNKCAPHWPLFCVMVVSPFVLPNLQIMERLHTPLDAKLMVPLKPVAHYQPGDLPFASNRMFSAPKLDGVPLTGHWESATLTVFEPTKSAEYQSYRAPLLPLHVVVHLQFEKVGDLLIPSEVLGIFRKNKKIYYSFETLQKVLPHANPPRWLPLVTSDPFHYPTLSEEGLVVADGCNANGRTRKVKLVPTLDLEIKGQIVEVNPAEHLAIRVRNDKTKPNTVIEIAGVLSALSLGDILTYCACFIPPPQEEKFDAEKYKVFISKLPDHVKIMELPEGPNHRYHTTLADALSIGYPELPGSNFDFN